MRLKVTVLLTALLLALVLGPAGPASAASCKGATCQNKNPQTSGCAADAVDLADITDAFRIELRYSPTCQAAWTRLTAVHSSAYYGVFISWTAAIDYGSIAPKSGDHFNGQLDTAIPLPWSAGQVVYTNMVSLIPSATAVAQIARAGECYQGYEPCLTVNVGYTATAWHRAP
jgi:Protein of unknown function (DUF2690)